MEFVRNFAVNLSRSVRDGRAEGERMLSSVNKHDFINTLLPGVDGGEGDSSREEDFYKVLNAGGELDLWRKF